MDNGLQPFLDMSGYTPKTTFWQDFTIAEQFGLDAVRETFDKAFKEWKSNTEYITELTMMLNWKIWHHHQNGNVDYAKLYDELWGIADIWCMDNLKGDDLSYFLKTTD